MSELHTIDVYRAWTRVSPYIVHTPLEASLDLCESDAERVWFKLENLQVSGSFKPRGAFNKMLSVLPTHKNAEFIAPTAGGHGVGLAYAASKLGVRAHVYLPRTADPDKLRTLQQLGADIRYFDGVPEAREAALKAAKEHGYVFVSAYNDRHMVEGAGTVGLEILKDCPEVDTVLVGVGGGGLISGLGLVLKAANPSIRLIGVQAENCPVLAEWFLRGHPVDVPTQPTMAEGIGVSKPEHDLIAWPYIQHYVDEFVRVSEDEIRGAVEWMAVHGKYIVEPAGVVGLAAYFKLKPRRLGRTVVVVTGRNVSWQRFNEILKR